MVYMLVRSRGPPVKGPHGAVTTQPHQLVPAATANQQYPHPAEVAEALPSRVTAARASVVRRKAQYESTARKHSVFTLASSAVSPIMADELAAAVGLEVTSAPGSPQGSMQAMPNAASSTRSVSSPTGGLLTATGPGSVRGGSSSSAGAGGPSLHVTQFLLSGTGMSFNPSKPHSATAASPLAPVLVNGIDVQACLFHVGAQKKWFYEDTLASIQTAALSMVSPEMREKLERRFPDVLSKCRGVLGALAAVSTSVKAIAPMPTAGSRAVVSLGHSGPGVTPMPTRGSADDLAGSIRSRPDTANRATPDWTPEMIARQLHRSPSIMEKHGSETHIVRTDTFMFSSFEHAAEDLLSNMTAQQVAHLYDTTLPASPDTPGAPMPAVTSPGHDAAEDKLNAMRQQLLQRRIEHLKVRETKSRKDIEAGLGPALRTLFDDIVQLTRNSLTLDESARFRDISARFTQGLLRVHQSDRQARHERASTAVARLAAEQEAAVSAETASRIAAIERMGVEDARAVQRAFAHMDSRIRTAISQDREERLRRLLAHRRANPATFFPDYADDEVDDEFVPMRIATDEEYARQTKMLEHRSE